MRTVSERTGLDLVLDGHTTRRPASGRPGGRPAGLAPTARDRPVLVSFATADEVPALAGRVAGIGGSSWSQDVPGHLSYGTGEITLDADAFRGVIRGAQGPQLARAIVLHEFGHLVGLAHVHDQDELMNKENQGLLDFGPGDLQGLSMLGQGRCT